MAAVDFGSEAHVDARNFFGKDCCAGTETDGQELCVFMSIFGGWRRAVVRIGYLLRCLSVLFEALEDYETYSLQLAHALQ